MSPARHPVLASGLLLGTLFFATALINGSGAWPLIWPFLGGVLVVLLAATQGRVGWGEGAALGLKAGLVGLLFVVIIGTPILYLYTGEEVRGRLDGRFGLSSDGVVIFAVILALLGLINTIIALVGALVAVPASHRAAPGGASPPASPPA